MHRCHAKCVIGFSLFSRDLDGRSISNFYRFVSLCIWWITLSAYTASYCFVRKKQFCNIPLMVSPRKITPCGPIKESCLTN